MPRISRGLTGKAIKNPYFSVRVADPCNPCPKDFNRGDSQRAPGQIGHVFNCMRDIIDDKDILIMNKDFPGNRWLTAFVSFVILFNACACSASSQNTTHASTATAGAIATKVPATQTPTPEPTATPAETPTPEATATATVEPLILPEPVTKFELGKFSQLPEITIDQAESPEFDAYLDKEEAAGKLGDFSKYAEPFSPKWGNPPPDYATNGRGSFTAKLLTIINVPSSKNGSYVLTNTRPCYNEAYFKTSYNKTDYLLWAQRWKNPDGSTARIKYIYPINRIKTLSSQRLGYLNLVGSDEAAILSPVLFYDFSKIPTISVSFYDRGYYDSYWKTNGDAMLKLARDLANNDPQNISTSDFSKFVWSPGLAVTNWMGPAY